MNTGHSPPLQNTALRESLIERPNATVPHLIFTVIPLVRKALRVGTIPSESLQRPEVKTRRSNKSGIFRLVFYKMHKTT